MFDIFSDLRRLQETSKTLIEEEATAARTDPVEAAASVFPHHLTPALFFIPPLLRGRHYCYTLTFPPDP